METESKADLSEEAASEELSRSRWPKWTGFKDKTLWDLFSLLFIPLVLAGVGFGFAFWQDARQDRIEDKRIAAQNALQVDRAQEEALQSYLDRMTDLLLSETSFTDEQYPRAQAIARSRTLTVFRNLDPERKGAAITFLYEAGSLLQPQTITETFTVSTIFVSLSGADLSEANLSGADLEGAYLSGANLSGANLTGANLYEADLYDASLDEADLRWAYLYGAKLSAANLSGANLYEANLVDAELWAANLEGANLTGADLSMAFLMFANLSEANLDGADLSGANLNKAFLDGADLSGARYNNNTRWTAGFDPEAEGAIIYHRR